MMKVLSTLLCYLAASMTAVSGARHVPEDVPAAVFYFVISVLCFVAGTLLLWRWLRELPVDDA